MSELFDHTHRSLNYTLAAVFPRFLPVSGKPRYESYALWSLGLFQTLKSFIRIVKLKTFLFHLYIGSAVALNENTFALTSCKNIFSKGKKKVPFLD